MRHTLLACLLLLSCQKATPKKLPPPADYLGVVSVKSLDGTAARIDAFLQTITPGTKTGLTGRAAEMPLAMLVSARSLDGLAFDKPMHLVVLDPKKFTRPCVLVGTVVDQSKLAAAVGEQNLKVVGGRALIGDKPVFDIVETWALATLTEGPEAPTMRLDLARLVERYRPEIDGFRQQMAPLFAKQPLMATMFDVEMDVMTRLAAQTQELTLALDVDVKEANLEIALIPRPGTTLEAFGKAQVPATLDLLGKIPGVDAADYVLVGNYHLGPVREAVYELMAGMLGGLLGAPPDAAFKKRWDAALDHFAGPIGSASKFEKAGGISFAQIAEVDDGARAVADAKALFPLSAPRTFEVMGMKLTLELHEGVGTHQGVSIDEYSLALDLASLPPEQQEMLRKMYGEKLHLAMAGKGKFFYMTWGTNAVAALDPLLDGASGSPSPAAKSALSAATGRRASFAMFMNLTGALAAMTGRTATAESGISFEMSFPDGTSRLRIAVPAVHVRELQGLVGR
jgi:hypothetical protein